MIKLIKYFNHECGNECLCEETENGIKVIEKQNYYHDNISDKINGFIDALNYLGIEYELRDCFVEDEYYCYIDLLGGQIK